MISIEVLYYVCPQQTQANHTNYEITGIKVHSISKNIPCAQSAIVTLLNPSTMLPYYFALPTLLFPPLTYATLVAQSTGICIPNFTALYALEKPFESVTERERKRDKEKEREGS